jgi:D-sedoheptulose 7-phosphate isomerase
MHKLNMTTAAYLENLRVVLDGLDRPSFDGAIQAIADGWQAGCQIITLGNGGSSLAALHYVTDWNKSIYLSTGKAFLGRSLVDNMGLVMAYGNDTSFAEVFVEQLRNVMRPGDVVIAISGSGNSENVIRAVDFANENGAVTIGVCGYDGGRLKEKVKHLVWANVNDMQLSEDVHCIFGHIVMRALGDYCK